MQKTIEQRIRSGYGDMRKSEQRAADYILDHLNQVRELSLDRLANEADVSQPTVIRMLKALGFKGYREFRDQLLGEYARDEEGEGKTTPLYGYPLHKGERLEDIPRNMTAMTERMLQETLKNFSVKTYKQIVEVLKHARIIDIYSVENSEVTAQDFVAKLLYLGFSCRHFGDHYYQRIAAGSLTSEDVAVGISYSGSSKDTVDVMKTAKKAGATTIVLTNFKDSPISRYADYLICTSQEQLFYGDAIFSRASQFLIVDMIYMGIIASDYDYYVRQLDSCEKVVREHAYET
ncbi:MAG: MurR/RpiR family transcriptional regulator [Lachnospiraceae bacterium]|nr:MurR/RpiR family transcriptional regulator [Lachnospiraceae bacterium]